MKIKITYKNDGQIYLSCWATTVLPSGQYVSTCADTYEEALAKLVTKIQEQKKEVAIPPSEEVEVEDGTN